jgi:sugar phosphate isomerase/epimerase
MNYTRRDISKIALAALAGEKLLAKPNSNFAGVQIGIIISPVLFHDMPLGADEILKKLVEAGISAVELQDVRVEAYAGAPEPARATGRNPTPEQQEARRKSAKASKEWRLSASMNKYKALHQMYRDAGVSIYAFRVAAINKDTTDQELAYFFNTAEALGANQITLELPSDPALSQRLGDHAAKRKIWMGYHNHTQVNFNSWDTALEQSKYNGINFDVGHFAAAVSQSPIPFIEKHHDRITCLHLKDRKFGTDGGKNVPWGQGDTPLKEVLALMKKEKYKFPAGIELEYSIPENSNTMAEISKCLQFCKDALA